MSIVVFSDFQCPYCAALAPTLRSVMSELPPTIQVQFKNFPLSFHVNARLAHHAALAAGAQGQFWRMHDWIFAHQRTIQRQQLIGAAREIGLDMDRFLADLDNPKWDDIIRTDIQEGGRLGVIGTPTFFINRTKHVGASSVQTLEGMVNAELASAGMHPISFKPLATSPKATATGQVQLEWFSDVRSPLSLEARTTLMSLRETYRSKLQITYRAVSLPFHSNSQLAQEGLLAAAAKDKFWEMLNLIGSWQGPIDAKTLALLGQKAELPDGWIDQALEKHTYKPVLEADALVAQKLSVKGVPVFFINGKRIDGIQPIGVFRDYIDAALVETNSTLR